MWFSRYQRSADKVRNKYASSIPGLTCLSRLATGRHVTKITIFQTIEEQVSPPCFQTFVLYWKHADGIFEAVTPQYPSRAFEISYPVCNMRYDPVKRDQMLQTVVNAGYAARERRSRRRYW